MLRIRGHHHDARPRSQREDPRRQLNPRHPRHLDVGQQNGRPDHARRHEPERLAPIRRDDGLDAGIVEPVGNPRANDRLVIDHEDEV